MFMNKMGNGANLSNSIDVVANSIKLIRRINGVDVLLEKPIKPIKPLKTKKTQN